MLRKFKAAWRLLFSDGYILCTLDYKQMERPVFDHNVDKETVLHYNGFLNYYYTEVEDWEKEVMRQVREILSEQN